MRFVPIHTIRVSPERQRQYFDPEHLGELQNSIGRLGLIQPLVITDDNQLVAGERRLKCLEALHMLGMPILFNGEQIPLDMVPAVLPNEAGNVALFEIELEENIKRQDLTWQEQAAALAQLKKFRSMQAKVEGRTEPSVADIAEEVEGRRDGAYQEKTRKALIVSKHLDNPDILKAKSVEDAFKILKKQEQAASNTAKTAAMGDVVTAERFEAYHDSCLAWGWEHVEAGGQLFDVICTDPPYGMSAQKFGDAGGSYVGITHEYQDSKEEWLTLMNKFAQLSWAITKPDAHMYLACDIDGFHYLKELLTQTGWRVHRTPLVNVKSDANRVPWPDQGPRRSYELVLYAVRGRKTTTAIYSDVFTTSGDENLGHGAQKPVAFWEDLLRRSIQPGDRILDPFAGTGGILLAADKLSAYCTVVEREAAYFGIILNRIEELVK